MQSWHNIGLYVAFSLSSVTAVSSWCRVSSFLSLSLFVYYLMLFWTLCHFAFHFNWCYYIKFIAELTGFAYHHFTMCLLISLLALVDFVHLIFFIERWLNWLPLGSLIIRMSLLCMFVRYRSEKVLCNCFTTYEHRLYVPLIYFHTRRFCCLRNQKMGRRVAATTWLWCGMPTCSCTLAMQSTSRRKSSSEQIELWQWPVETNSTSSVLSGSG